MGKPHRTTKVKSRRTCTLRPDEAVRARLQLSRAFNFESSPTPSLAGRVCFIDALHSKSGTHRSLVDCTVRLLTVCHPESEGGDHHHAPFPPIKAGDICLVSLTLEEKCHVNYDECGIDVFLGKGQQAKYAFTNTDMNKPIAGGRLLLVRPPDKIKKDTGRRSHHSSAESLHGHSRASRSNSPHGGHRSSRRKGSHGSGRHHHRRRHKGAGTTGGGSFARLTGRPHMSTSFASGTHGHGRQSMRRQSLYTRTADAEGRIGRRQSLYRCTRGGGGIMPMMPHPEHEQSSLSLQSTRTELGSEPGPRGRGGANGGDVGGRRHSLCRGRRELAHDATNESGSTTSLLSAHTTPAPEGGESDFERAPEAEAGLSHNPRRTSLAHSSERRLSQTTRGSLTMSPRHKRSSVRRAAKGLAAPFGSSHK